MPATDQTDQTDQPPTFIDDALDAADPKPTDSEPDDLDPDFLPRTPTRRHWLTSVLIWLAVLSAGFLLGVLADRAIAG